MPFLLDTNLLVHFVRSDALGQRLKTDYALLTSPDVPLLSAVTEGELRALARKFAWGKAKMEQMEFFLTCFVIVPISAPGIMAAYAVIDDFSTRRGRLMGKNDVWIAATAHVTTATLLTTDRDFDHLDPAYLTRRWINPQTR